TGQRPSTVSFLSFALLSLPLSLTSMAVWCWTRRWHLPPGVGLSWRGVVLHVARWPIVFWALISVILRIKHPYMITPKGQASGLPRFSLVSQAPYLALCWVNVAAIWLYALRRNDLQAQGYMLFAVLGALWMLGVMAT